MVYGWQAAFVKAGEDDGGLTGPLAKAAELLLLAEPFGADEALRLGLVNAVLPQSRAFAPRDGEEQPRSPPSRARLCSRPGASCAAITRR